MIDIYKKLLEFYELGIDAVLCTVVSTKGSTPLKEGAKMIVCKNNTYGSVGGGKTEKTTIEKARELLLTSSNTKISIDLLSETGTSCGGKVEIYFEPLKHNSKLYIFGAGHVGKALADVVKDTGFDVSVIDDRKGIFDDWKNDSCSKIVSDIQTYLDCMQFDDNTYITIITYDHDTDWKILSFCAMKEWRYLGMMGSHNKAKSMKSRLLKMDVSDDIINKMNMPVGLEINAESAREIAVSIVAKLIKVKNSVNIK